MSKNLEAKLEAPIIEQLTTVIGIRREHFELTFRFSYFLKNETQFCFFFVCFFVIKFFWFSQRENFYSRKKTRAKHVFCKYCDVRFFLNLTVYRKSIRNSTAVLLSYRTIKTTKYHQNHKKHHTKI